MTELLNKISSYNLFNNLLPGVLFAAFLNHFTEYNISQNNLLFNAFLYYFIGLTISRVSSITIEPILKKIKFVKFRDYSQFVNASKKDSRLDILVETSNTFRVLLTVLLLVLLAKGYYSINLNFLKLNQNIQEYLLLAIIAVIYLFAYRKQTEYITKRIDANN